MIDPGPYTQAGIQLAQQGRKAEALPYLRRAVTSEPMTADVWLWLAHVSPDILEYRNCVYQALRLQPDHPTAQRMQSDLDYQSQGVTPPAMASREMDRLEQRSRRQRRWRTILLLLILILLAALCGRTALLVIQEEGLTLDDFQALIPSETGKNVTFTVGEDPGIFTFEVRVPESWLLADEGSNTWQREREALETEFPPAAGLPNIWEGFETNPSEVQFDAVTGSPTRAVTIVETDAAKIRRDPEHPANLSLAAISTLPPADNQCEALELLAEQQLSSYQQNVGFVRSEVVERKDGSCIHYVELREAMTETRQFAIYAPMTAQGMMVWQLTVPEILYEDYRETIDEILESLHYVER